ncbi:flavin reductase family protein [Salsipaludibacter albus]|uniref:flavin reductase family protein n=1 Tax=Salsipaludibacter albus TaxID=2849650 RepID=UPI001EE47093|nr:flavin reductase family protein [Salsipaludibacter albus]
MDNHDRAAASDAVAPVPDSRAFRAVMSRFATGVTVMTAMDDQGEVTGMTANAVASVSLEPLLVLVCVERTTDMARRVRSGGRFALSMLPATARKLSDHFANPDRSRGWAGFTGIETIEAVTGVPILAEALGWLDCRVHDLHEGGDHWIVVGEVVAAALGDAGPALGYFDHDYVEIPTPG